MKIYQPINHNIVHFKVKPMQYINNESGRKKNIIKIVNSIEDKAIIQSVIKYILIEDSFTDRKFIKELTDITRYIYNDIIIYIFSWD